MVDTLRPSLKWLDYIVSGLLELCQQSSNRHYYQLEIKNAFLHGDLQKEVYMAQPPSYELQREPTNLYRVKKAIYYLKQSPRAFFDQLVL